MDIPAIHLVKTDDVEDTPLTEVQIGGLVGYMQQRMDKHQKLDRTEEALIDDPNKNVYCMWGHIKRRCPKDDSITWPHATAAKHCHCSKSDVAEIMGKLVKAGAVTQLEKGKQGSNSHQAAIYRREV